MQKCCVPGPVQCTGSGVPHVSGGSGAPRAWLCVFVLVSDALRGVLDSRFLRLLRIERIFDLRKEEKQKKAEERAGEKDKKGY